MKRFNWNTIKKISAIFGIIGGVYLIITLVKSNFSNEIKVKSDFLVQELNLPEETQYVNHYNLLNDELDEVLDQRELAKAICDSITDTQWGGEFIKNKKLLELTIRTSIIEAYQNRNISKIISDTLSQIYRPINNARYYIEIHIKNEGNKPLKNLRLESSKNEGYFELYENGGKLKNGYFENNILTGNLRTENSFTLKMWINYFNSYTSLRFTHDNGSIIPVEKDIITGEGLLYWMMKNKFLAIYYFFLIVFLGYSIYQTLKNN